MIDNIRFRAKGCVPAMACGSAITELVKGKTVAQAAKIQSREVIDAVGGVPQASSHAAQLAVDALAAALKQMKS